MLAHTLPCFYLQFLLPGGADDNHRPSRATADPPVGAPLRPGHYVCRDRLSAAAAAALLRGAGGGSGGGWRGGAVVAFTGSPGAGKACLAAEVVGRKDVRAKFGEGVLWLQVRGLPVPVRDGDGGSIRRLVVCGHRRLFLRIWHALSRVSRPPATPCEARPRRQSLAYRSVWALLGCEVNS